MQADPSNKYFNRATNGSGCNLYWSKIYGFHRFLLCFHLLKNRTQINAFFYGQIFYKMSAKICNRQNILLGNSIIVKMEISAWLYLVEFSTNCGFNSTKTKTSIGGYLFFLEKELVSPSLRVLQDCWTNMFWLRLRKLFALQRKTHQLVTIGVKPQ